jgi:hypothetical protein
MFSRLSGALVADPTDSKQQADERDWLAIRTAGVDDGL